MAFDFKQKLPTPQEIREMYPVPDHVAQIKKERDEEIRKIFTGESDRFIAIIGPCSADNEEAVCDYVRRLVQVQEKIKDKVLIIPRIYTNKPRTTGDGYKGISRIRRRSRTRWLASSPCDTCTSAPSKRPA